ncbi:T9SS type A sorting domain-containing protein [Chryseobacterium aahli]|uniref:T9SS type A sorting domain-containing protein n=1 Tax=Chryseobacterium aahli TaxID=1278643 RepID=UPI001F61AE16|nr:T9SS type A sorting domain-containing protein [Chryseobacterium aahli]MCI3937688.1 T9SS type A sorting domain-containing protein [Chryseobacterium aahli]
MRSTIFFTICSLFISIFSFGQTSTEVFETESNGSTSFTDNGVIFNILSQVGGFAIQESFPNTGWNGTANDNRYIDNNGAANVTTGASFSIKTTSNLFKVNRFWVFLSANNLDQTVAGTLTVTGKLSGVTKYSQIKTTGFATGLGSTNGFTLIDLTNLNGQNYSNIIIDQLQVTIGGAYNYFCLDAFTWVKDTGLVLSTDELKKSKSNLSLFPNPTTGQFSIETSEDSKAQLYDQSGKILKDFELKKGINKENIAELPSGTYLLKTSSHSKKIIKR